MRGIVRSLSNAEKIDPLKKAYGPLFDNLELVEATLLDPETIKRAIGGSTYVIHVASPMLIEVVDDEAIVLKQAVEGTLSVLRAC